MIQVTAKKTHKKLHSTKQEKIIILEIWNYFSFSPTKTKKNRNENLKLKFLHSLKQDEKNAKVKISAIDKKNSL